MWQKIKNFLKRLLPPPTKAFNREIERLLAAMQAQKEETDRRLAALQSALELQSAQMEQAKNQMVASGLEAQKKLLENAEAMKRQAADQLADAQATMLQMRDTLVTQSETLQASLLDRLAAVDTNLHATQPLLNSLLSSAEKSHSALQTVETLVRQTQRKNPFAKEPTLPAETMPIRTAADSTDANPPAGFDRVIPVVFATNDTYAPYTGVAIESILRNAGTGNYYRIYILHDGLSRYHREGLDHISAPNATVRCIEVSKKIETHRQHMFAYAHFSRETYFRFLVPELFPFFREVIYLDGDLVAQTDIAQILPEDMGNDLIAGVHNISTQIYGEQRRMLGLDLNEYINAGVMVINVQKWIQEDISAQCFEMLKTIPPEDLLCLDQDIVNKVCAGRIYLLPPEWNFCWNMVYGTEEQRALFAPTAEKIGNNFHILHFASWLKPWDVPQTGLSGCFWKYARTSCFYEEILSKGICK